MTLEILQSVPDQNQESWSDSTMGSVLKASSLLISCFHSGSIWMHDQYFISLAYSMHVETTIILGSSGYSAASLELSSTSLQNMFHQTWPKLVAMVL